MGVALVWVGELSGFCGGLGYVKVRMQEEEELPAHFT